MAVGFASLPVELLVSLTSYLSTTEYGNLRRTCRAIERALFRFWAPEFFSIRQICIFGPSLDNLLAISQHRELKHHVKKIIIGLDKLPDVSESVWGELHAKSLLHIEHTNMMMHSRWKDMLQDILVHLPALQYLQVRDFQSTRLRPREHTTWRGYGIKTIEQQFKLRFPDGPCGASDILMGAILQICARTDTRLLSIENICRNAATRICSLYIPQAQLSHYKSALSLMTQFFITLSLDDLRSLRAELQTENIFGRVLSCMPGLKHLRLNFAWVMPGSGAREAATPILQSIIENQLGLEKLELGFAHVDFEACKKVISSVSKTLQSLTLHKSTLQKDTMWSEFFYHLGCCQHLSSLNINMCRGEDFVVWKARPADVLHYDSRTLSVWPARESVKLEGPNGDEIGTAALARMVLPNQYFKGSGHAVFRPGSRRLIRFLSKEPTESLSSKMDESSEASHAATDAIGGSQDSDDSSDDWNADAVMHGVEDDEDDEDDGGHVGPFLYHPDEDMTIVR